MYKPCDKIEAVSLAAFAHGKIVDRVAIFCRKAFSLENFSHLIRRVSPQPHWPRLRQRGPLLIAVRPLALWEKKREGAGMMKRLMTCVAALLVLLCGCGRNAGTVEVVQVETATEGDYTYTYTVDNGGATLIGPNKKYTLRDGSVYQMEYVPAVSPGPSGTFVIPSIVAGHEVTGIGDGAFCAYGDLTHVTIPSSIKTIGECAFSSCTNLTSVTISHGVTSIEGAAFYKCRGLTNVTIPSSVTSIQGAAFLGCDSLLSVTVPKGTTIRVNTFPEGCEIIRE
jgi:hypothetical protein